MSCGECGFIKIEGKLILQNDPELDPKFLGKISSDFVKIADTLREASFFIRKQGFSDFPVFPMCQVPQPIDQVLIEAFQAENDWHYPAPFVSGIAKIDLATL